MLNIKKKKKKKRKKKKKKKKSCRTQTQLTTYHRKFDVNLNLSFWVISGMTATQLEKLAKVAKLCAVHQFAADYNNKAHNVQWALQEAPNANKEVSSGYLRFTLTT